MKYEPQLRVFIKVLPHLVSNVQSQRVHHSFHWRTVRSLKSFRSHWTPLSFVESRPFTPPLLKKVNWKVRTPSFYMTSWKISSITLKIYFTELYSINKIGVSTNCETRLPLYISVKCGERYRCNYLSGSVLFLPEKPEFSWGIFNI